jgi:hypothetical protein
MNELAVIAALTAFLVGADHLSFRGPGVRVPACAARAQPFMRQLEYYVSCAGAVGGDPWRRRAAIAK